jgi:hypothetical protein
MMPCGSETTQRSIPAAQRYGQGPGRGGWQGGLLFGAAAWRRRTKRCYERPRGQPAAAELREDRWSQILEEQSILEAIDHVLNIQSAA